MFIRVEIVLKICEILIILLGYCGVLGIFIFLGFFGWWGWVGLVRVGKRDKGRLGCIFYFSFLTGSFGVVLLDKVRES